MAKPNRKYKDTVFRMLYGNDKKELLNLYNAVNDTAYKDPKALKITTLENALYVGMKNDISFLLQDVVSLYEHQSTVNPNMPLRDLFYVADVLQELTKNVNLYTRKLRKIAAPRFVMFYNGTEDLKGISEYRLSDMYAVKEEHPQLELIVKIINIDAKQNNRILKKCRSLWEYAEFVRTVRTFLRKYPLKEAIKSAVDDCIERGILREFLKKHKARVIKVSIYEFDAEKHEKAIRAEAWEDGHEAGLSKGRAEREALKEENAMLREQLAKYEKV